MRVPLSNANNHGVAIKYGSIFENEPPQRVLQKAKTPAKCISLFTITNIWVLSICSEHFITISLIIIEMMFVSFIKRISYVYYCNTQTTQAICHQLRLTATCNINHKVLNTYNLINHWSITYMLSYTLYSRCWVWNMLNVMHYSYDYLISVSVSFIPLQRRKP